MVLSGGARNDASCIALLRICRWVETCTLAWAHPHIGPAPVRLGLCDLFRRASGDLRERELLSCASEDPLRMDCRSWSVLKLTEVATSRYKRVSATVEGGFLVPFLAQMCIKQ
jgi:hypothetical protein